MLGVSPRSAFLDRVPAAIVVPEVLALEAERPLADAGHESGSVVAQGDKGNSDLCHGGAAQNASLPLLALSLLATGSLRRS
jgi:hypothetical protein